jgi:hypothetical protein
MAFQDVCDCEAPRCRGEPLGSIEARKHRCPTVTVCILRGHIVESLRDFAPRTPFEQQKFNYGALFLFNIHYHFSVPAV